MLIGQKKLVKVLQLGNYVDYCLSKPEYYVDDKFPEEFMHRQNRIYYPPEKK